MWPYNPNEEKRRWADMLSDDSDMDIVSPVPTVSATVSKGNTTNTVTASWQPKKRIDKEAKPWGTRRDKSQWRQRRSTQTTVAPTSPMGSISTVEDTAPTDSSPQTDSSRNTNSSRTDAPPRIDASSQTTFPSPQTLELRAKQALERTLEEERARHSDQIERLMLELDSVQQEVEKEKTLLRQERLAWEQERKKLLEDMAADNARIEREVTESVTECFESELRVKAEATESMRTRFEEENRELRDTVKAGGATLKAVRKDHNAHVQKLQAKMDAAVARASQKEKKQEKKHAAMQCDLQCDQTSSVHEYQDLNRKLIQKFQNNMQEKKNLQEQLQAADDQLDVQSAECGAQSRQIKDLEKRIREALVHKKDAVVSAERFHEQNKVLLLERKTLATQVQSLQKQLNCQARNNKLLDTK
eukprot:GEMP01033605.1.p1 GENE.GEMP01033605.1~~GEMP01033605.1.p1  ORF type:complete len:416 (+),score=109.64 GEMP01033605.1:243-1490(+)